MNKSVDQKVYVHGHRGCRGLLPENTTAAFAYACELGADYLELDVVLTGDGNILVSHDPYMHHEICAHHDGTPVSADEELNLNIWKMTTAEAQSFVTGSFVHPRFPQQKQASRSKPTLAQTVSYINDFCSENQLRTPFWNIEIKSQPEWDNVYHPAPSDYVSIFLKQFATMGIADRAIIQSFDHRILEELHIQDPTLRLVYLSERPGESAEKSLQMLSFKPYGFSPQFELADTTIVSWCKANDMEMIVWTVNEESDIQRMLDMGVRHIISDYPDRVISILKKSGTR